ncbi:iron ABC transporter permease [Ochrobactrum pseudogrignonense]|nr:iron ABC transporter permease [Brucella pseudogrignonensis]
MNAVRLDTSAHHYYAAGSNKSRLLWLLLLATILVLASGLSIGLGTRAVSLAEILNALNGHRETMGEAAVALRIPRTLLAIIAGAALGLAGCVMQGITRNPLADPGILGVNMGAALAMVIAIAWFNIGSTYAPIWVAIGGAGAAATLFISWARWVGGATPLKLALAGAATSVAFSSLVVAIILPRADLAGSIRAGRSAAWRRHFRSDRPCIAVSGVWAGDQSIECPKTEFTRIGRGTCSGLGENVAFARLCAAIGAIFLCGATTAICGPIGFVGLVVPHLCRLLIGVDHRWLLPFSAITGAVLLVTSDIIGRVIARPTEIDVGIITAFLGAPFFIYIVRRQRVREL